MKSDSDVLIIGAGVIGCLTAMNLTQRGMRVTIVDKGILGAESSWAAGGILFPLLPSSYSESVNRLVLKGASLYRNLADKLFADTGVNVEYSECGLLALPSAENKKVLAWCKKLGLTFDFSDAGALWLPQVAQIRSPRLMQALRAWMHMHQVKVLEGVEMAHINQRNGKIDGWRSTKNSLFQADHYIVTSGAWSKLLLKRCAPYTYIRPRRGQMLLYRIAPNQLKHIVYQENFYLIPRLDGHVLAGSTVEDVGFDRNVTIEAASALHSKSISILPELADATVIKQWSGLRPGSPENIPIIARYPNFNNLWINSGHFRYGISMAPASAEHLANLMANETLTPNEYQFQI